MHWQELAELTVAKSHVTSRHLHQIADTAYDSNRMPQAGMSDFAKSNARHHTSDFKRVWGND